MRIAVLDATTHPQPLLQGLPTAAEQITAWLGPALPAADLVQVHIAHGDAVPDSRDFDGFVVSGSEKGVYDDTAWMQPLRQLLLDCRAAGRPIFGICFGHQIMADTLGGKARLADIGMVVGAREFDYRGTRVNAHVWHQDQVTELPPGVTVSGHSEHCPVGALDYPFPARSVQFHPEYRKEAMLALFERGRGHFVTDDQISAATASFSARPVAPDLAARDAADLFRKHAAS